MNANEEAKDFIKSLENLNEKKYVILLKQLKELGATKSKKIKFDWKSQNAPSIVGECFDDDIIFSFWINEVRMNNITKDFINMHFAFFIDFESFIFKF